MSPFTQQTNNKRSASAAMDCLFLSTPTKRIRSSEEDFFACPPAPKRRLSQSPVTTKPAVALPSFMDFPELAMPSPDCESPVVRLKPRFQQRQTSSTSSFNDDLHWSTTGYITTDEDEQEAEEAELEATTDVSTRQLPIFASLMTVSSSMLDLKTSTSTNSLQLKPRLNKKLCRVASFNAIAA